MFNINDLHDLEVLISKIDFTFIIKICVEILLYFVFLFVTKKIVETFFGKIVAKIHDIEIKKQYDTIQFICISTINVVITLFFATNILGAFGVDMKPILATAGVLGVAVGFGAKRFVEDVISGLQILLTGQLRVGDSITIDTSNGMVEKVNLLMIKIRTINGDVHFIRNGLVDKVINHTRDFSYPIIEIPVSYEADIPFVMNVLSELAFELKNNSEYSKFILADPEVLGIDSFDESSIMLKVRFKTVPAQQWAIQRKFRIMVKQKFDELNISIPYNQLDVNIKQN